MTKGQKVDGLCRIVDMWFACPSVSIPWEVPHVLFQALRDGSLYLWRTEELVIGEFNAYLQRFSAPLIAKGKTVPVEAFAYGVEGTYQNEPIRILKKVKISGYGYAQLLDAQGVKRRW